MTKNLTCLQLDVGNSSTKWRLVRDGKIFSRCVYFNSDPDSRKVLENCADKLDAIWISSVASAQAEAELGAMLFARWQVQPWFARTTASGHGVRNSYSDPSRMGVDRWLAMIGARRHCEKRLCIVDAGSALTIDIVAASGQHEGGYIIPGSALMEQALLLDTDRVRFDEPVEYSLTPGISTAEAVRHGVALAQTGAIALVLDRFCCSQTAVYFCGGGGREVMTLLGGRGSYRPDLVFEGLETVAPALS